MTIVVFKSKTEVFAFVELARGNGIGASVVGTPKEIKIGCGLSAKISESQVYFAKRIIRNNHFSTFHGIYTVKKISGTGVMKKLM